MNADNKINHFRNAEKEIGKNLSRIYKNITGRGPISIEARVVSQSIFIAYKTEMAPFEQMMYGYIQSKSQEQEFFSYIRPTFIAVINTFAKQLNPFLNVNGMEFRVDEDTTYMLITLNKNLEKMLFSGEAKLSHDED